MCRELTSPAEFEGLVQRNLAASCSFSFLDFTSLLHLAVQRSLTAGAEALEGRGCDSADTQLGDHAHRVRLAADQGRQTCACVQRWLQALLGLKRTGLVMRVLCKDMAAFAALDEDAGCEDWQESGGLATFTSFAQAVQACRQDLAAIGQALSSSGLAWDGD